MTPEQKQKTMDKIHKHGWSSLTKKEHAEYTGTAIPAIQNEPEEDYEETGEPE